MISLLFKFLGDSTPLKREAEKAKKEMSTAGGGIGQAFGGQFKSAVMGAIGLGAIVSGVKAAFDEIKRAAPGATLAGRGIKEEMALNRAATATGLTQEELMEQGKRNPEQFAAMMRQFESPIDENQLRSTARGAEKAKTWTGQAFDFAASQFVTGVERGFSGVKAVGAFQNKDYMGAARYGVEALAGVSRDQLSASPTESFLQSVRTSRQSDAEFNAMVDEVNQRLEAIKEAVEKS